jgi:hypothetical protein
MPLRSHLEILDRRYPGTYRRKLKRLEIFLEGLVPVDGIYGSLTHQGISTEWRKVGGGWQRFTHIVPPERMVISSYQIRRDITVFQPSAEQLALFENLGPEGNWMFELPRSANNIDYEAISDVKLVLYFDADYSESLASHLQTVLGATGGRALVLSARFHVPDEYFRLDVDREIVFELPGYRFAYNHTDLSLQGFAARLTGTDGSPLDGRSLTVTRGSDGSSVTGSTDASGLLAGHPGTMAPFADWKGDSPQDTFTVALGDGIDPQSVGDIQLSIDYAFNYRPNGVMPT